MLVNVPLPLLRNSAFAPLFTTYRSRSPSPSMSPHAPPRLFVPAAATPAVAVTLVKVLLPLLRYSVLDWPLSLDTYRSTSPSLS